MARRALFTPVVFVAAAAYETKRRRIFYDQICAVVSSPKPSLGRRYFDPRLTWNQNWDAQWRDKAWNDATLIDPKNPPFTRKILLVRHGQYECEEKTDEKRVLTPLGRQQAKQTGERLALLFKDKKIRAIITSDMTRAKETAQIILETLNNTTIPVYEDSLLAEGYPSYIVPRGNYKFSRQKVKEGNARIETAFRKYIWRPPVSQDKGTEEWTVLICHGNVIRYLLCRALQFPSCAWLRFSHPNCGLTILGISANGYTHVSAFGDSGHLPPEQITFN